MVHTPTTSEASGVTIFTLQMGNWGTTRRD